MADVHSCKCPFLLLALYIIKKFSNVLYAEISSRYASNTSGINLNMHRTLHSVKVPDSRVRDNDPGKARNENLSVDLLANFRPSRARKHQLSGIIRRCLNNVFRNFSLLAAPIR